jgi:hypothetical protein
MLLHPGPHPECGYHVVPGPVRTAPFVSGLIDLDRTVQLDFYANRDGTLQASLATGRAVQVPVERGLNRMYLRLIGGGEYLRLSTTTEDLSVCVTGAVAGRIEAAPGLR